MALEPVDNACWGATDCERGRQQRSETPHRHGRSPPDERSARALRRGIWRMVPHSPLPSEGLLEPARLACNPPTPDLGAERNVGSRGRRWRATLRPVAGLGSPDGPDRGARAREAPPPSVNKRTDAAVRSPRAPLPKLHAQRHPSRRRGPNRTLQSSATASGGRSRPVNVRAGLTESEHCTKAFNRRDRGRSQARAFFFVECIPCDRGPCFWVARGCGLAPAAGDSQGAS